MKPLVVEVCFAGLVVAAWLVAPAPVRAAQAAPIAIDFPEADSIFPPEITSPLFLWRETSPAAIVWQIEVVFGERGPRVREVSRGEKLQVGELDTTLKGYVPPTLTPEQAEQHTWRPDRATWEAIK